MPIIGEIIVSGDKSISHRALMLGSLLSGESYISNLSTSKDVMSTIKCLKRCGVNISSNNMKVNIIGGELQKPEGLLDCENSGTTARLMLGILSSLNIEATLVGDKSLSKRPMNRVIEPLELMGASFNSNQGKLPITINSTSKLQPIIYVMPIASAQVKSSILFASLNTIGLTRVLESYNSRDHTELMLKEIGVDIKINNYIEITNPSLRDKCISIDVPGDPSSASFLIAAAVMIPKSSLKLKNILCNPRRIKYIDIINKMGGDISINNYKMSNGELIGDITVNYKPLRGIIIDEDVIPQIIDEIPILSLISTQANGETIINGISELRFKESDRVHAIKVNLEAMGASVNADGDSIIINGPKILYNTTIKTYSDHRIAMTFVIAGLLTGKFNIIDDIHCIENSFPEFFSLLKTICL